MFLQLLVNYIISLYYEERLNFIETHLDYLLDMSFKINRTAVTLHMSEEAIILLQHLKYKNGLSSTSRMNGSSWLAFLSGVRKILLINVLEIVKYYRIFLNNRAQFQEIYDYVATLDLARLKNNCLAQLNVVESETSETFHIVNMYHPLIANCKTHSVTIDQSMLITGTNASGKSIFLKMMGINLLFSKVLGFAFADKFNAPKLDIITYIDIKDNLFESESLFVAELHVIKRILKQKQAMAIIDEPFRGTNASESAALVYALIKTFQEEQRYYLISTHHKELAYEEKSSRRYYFDENKEKYQLYQGVTMCTNAVTLADGIIDDKQFCDLAKSYLAKK